jgi:hypothetical protein
VLGRRLQALEEDEAQRQSNLCVCGLMKSLFLQFEFCFCFNCYAPQTVT